MNYDDWKLDTPPEYKSDEAPECDCLAPGDIGMLCRPDEMMCGCLCHRWVKVIASAPEEDIKW